MTIYIGIRGTLSVLGRRGIDREPLFPPDSAAPFGPRRPSNDHGAEGGFGMPRIYVRTPAIERFWAKVDKTGECWLWTSPVNHAGYGKFWNAGRTIAAHKFAYQLTKGPVPDGLTIDHLCRVRHCVRPEHMEAVTLQVNLSRAIGRPESRTHCPQGHPYSTENMYRIWSKGSLERRCKACSHLTYIRRKGK